MDSVAMRRPWHMDSAQWGAWRLRTQPCERSSAIVHLFDDVCHLQESTFATTEAGIDDFIGSIDDAGHITALADGVKAELQTLELLVVWFEELQILCLEKVETLALQRQALREGEGILDRQAHIRHDQLGLDGSVHKLYGTMHHALRMDEHLYLVGRYAEKPLRFRHLKSLVHEGSRVDGYLGAHIPGRMLEGISCRHLLQLLVGKIAERSARTGKENLVDLVLILAHQTLEDGTMFTIYREDRRMILLSQLTDRVHLPQRGFPYWPDRFSCGP